MASAVAPVRHSAADRRQQILQAAMGLFARRGFNGTTTREIARRARVNEAIIFRHFPSKEDLYLMTLLGSRPGYQKGQRRTG